LFATITINIWYHGSIKCRLYWLLPFTRPLTSRHSSTPLTVMCLLRGCKNWTRYMLTGGRKRCTKPRLVLLDRAIVCCLSFVLRVYVVFCLPGQPMKRLVSEMTYYVLSATLNPINHVI